jgi:hypothetical protein
MKDKMASAASSPSTMIIGFLTSGDWCRPQLSEVKQRPGSLLRHIAVDLRTAVQDSAVPYSTTIWAQQAGARTDLISGAFCG